MLSSVGVTRPALLWMRFTKSTAGFVSMIPSLALSFIALLGTPGVLRSIEWRYTGIVDAYMLPAVVVVIGLMKFSVRKPGSPMPGQGAHGAFESA